MKSIYTFLILMIVVSACQSDFDNADLDSLLRNQDVSKERALKIIEKAYAAVESSELKTSLKNELRSNVKYYYTIYRSAGQPVKITTDIHDETYTVRATYYIHDSIPYFMQGTMRDQDRASGRYTHQELITYFNGKEVIKQLRKTALNKENRASDLSHIPSVDITEDIKQPDLDAILRYEEVKSILKIQ